MPIATKMTVMLALGALVATAQAEDWTPHSAAALLDASFASASACQHALEEARRHERTTPSEPVEGLSYARLFEQARCAAFQHKGAPAWRIRMHWNRRG